MTRLVLASANPKKAAELAALLGDRFELVPRPPEVPDVVEDADTFEGNARLKAVALCDATGLPALADDSGLEVDALGGAPGVWSARYAGEGATDAENVAKLLRELDGEDRRTARFRCVLVVRWPDGREVVAAGAVEGTVLARPAGEGGFGYDPVFVPTPDELAAGGLPDELGGRSFAELGGEAKGRISHRAKALAALLPQL